MDSRPVPDPPLSVFAYRVTSAVNLRSSPEVKADNVVCILRAGTSVSASETLLAHDGDKWWMYVVAQISGVTVNGWVAADYLTAR